MGTEGAGYLRHIRFTPSRAKEHYGERKRMSVRWRTQASIRADGNWP